jgi:hypothetical protein
MSHHRIEQVTTYSAPTEATMRDPNFQRGVADVREGRPFNPDGGVGADCTIGSDCHGRLINAQWDYERGRLFGACTAIPVFLDYVSLNPLTLAVLDAAFNRGLIL